MHSFFLVCLFLFFFIFELEFQCFWFLRMLKKDLPQLKNNKHFSHYARKKTHPAKLISLHFSYFNFFKLNFRTFVVLAIATQSAEVFIISFLVELTHLSLYYAHALIAATTCEWIPACFFLKPTTNA